MPLENCKEKDIICPYDEVHVVRESRLQFHLVKCKKNHKESRFVECPFNSTHKVPEIELNCHKLYLCADRKKVDTFICSTEDATPLFPVQPYEVPSSEDWDDVQVPSYDPIEHCNTHAIIWGVQGGTPSERKHHRAEHRQRYRAAIGAAGRNGHGQENVVPEKAPTRLPQTTPKAQMNVAGKSENSQDSSRGRGRGRILQ